jgi:hypothetical protein
MQAPCQRYFVTPPATREDVAALTGDRKALYRDKSGLAAAARAARHSTACVRKAC